MLFSENELVSAMSTIMPSHLKIKMKEYEYVSFELNSPFLRSHKRSFVKKGKIQCIRKNFSTHVPRKKKKENCHKSICLITI